MCIRDRQLAPCRALFYEKLRPRVAGLPLEEAILEVNRWCAEEATYRSTDGRTASALAVYLSLIHIYGPVVFGDGQPLPQLLQGAAVPVPP